jgi:Cytochrome P460
MLAAYRAGVPSNGKPFPDGSKIAKIERKPKKSIEAPFDVNIPASQQDVFFIEKDSKRFPATKGWAYAQCNYDPASGMFTPEPNGASCGFQCHTRVAAKDYIFTAAAIPRSASRRNHTARPILAKGEIPYPNWSRL